VVGWRVKRCKTSRLKGPHSTKAAIQIWLLSTRNGLLSGKGGAICGPVVTPDQRIDTIFLSRLSLIADTERLPIAAFWMCSLHQTIIGRLRSI
jgi:hypothetical protein